MKEKYCRQFVQQLPYTVKPRRPIDVYVMRLTRKHLAPCFSFFMGKKLLLRSLFWLFGYLGSNVCSRKNDERLLIKNQQPRSSRKRDKTTHLIDSVEWCLFSQIDKHKRLMQSVTDMRRYGIDPLIDRRSIWALFSYHSDTHLFEKKKRQFIHKDLHKQKHWTSGSLFFF